MTFSTAEERNKETVKQTGKPAGKVQKSAAPVPSYEAFRLQYIYEL